MPVFLDTKAVLLVRQILLLKLCRKEEKRGVMEYEGGYLCVDPVPEVAADEVLVILSKEIDKEKRPVFPIDGFAFVGKEILF